MSGVIVERHHEIIKHQKQTNNARPRNFIRK